MTVLPSEMAHNSFRRIFKDLEISGRNVSCPDEEQKFTFTCGVCFPAVL